MKNDFEVHGDVLVIFLDRKDGTRLETRVSAKHLERLQALPYKFFASWDNYTKSYYVVYHITKSNGKDSIRSLHRLITSCPKGKVVDHWDKDTLNNLDSNLNIVTSSQNLQNRNAIHTQNTTGYKGVSFERRTRKYVAQIKINKKHIWLGRYDTPEKAHEAYMRYRNKAELYLNTEVM
ncbi:AP2 domain-containing protein [Neobacillus niacini]|uniref:AP2 domain-containing protein n=1 Tax=Neobacillus niacini TaxID=86668 RepID=UPI002FFE9CB6